MIDLKALYNAFDVDEPLPADDTIRYVDLSTARGDNKIAKRLVQKIKNSPKNTSHHLIMGHTKCGKTTELNRAAGMLEKEGYVTVFFDVAEVASRTFEYTTVLLIMVGQIIKQLNERKPKIKINSIPAEKLKDYLIEREVTIGGQISGEGTVKGEAKFSPLGLSKLLGEAILGLELRGGYQKSREITTKIEADTRGFLNAIQEVVQEACSKVLDKGHKGLVVICDGCDKLAISATDKDGLSHDLQLSMFVDHASDLRDVPCHVIYTVPISIKGNLADSWEQMPEFVPAIPVLKLPEMNDNCAVSGRNALKEVVARRLGQHEVKIDDLFGSPDHFDQLLDASGGHISDLLLLVRYAILEAQIDEVAVISERHTGQSMLARAIEYDRLIEGKYLDVLKAIQVFKTSPGNSDNYRELIFKRLVLEYICDNSTYVDLHPLVATSKVYRRSI